VDVTPDVIAARTAHLTREQLRMAASYLRTPPAAIAGPWRGVVIGEMPSRTSSGRLPLFPWPASSSGGRLLKLSGMDPGAFLGRLLFRNLHPVRGDYGVVEDRRAANEHRTWLADQGSTRVLLLGARVASAFDLGGIWSRKGEVYDLNAVRLEYLSIGHPSRASLEYRDPQRRAAARTALLYVAGMLDV
jgi:hypothetical protein